MTTNNKKDESSVIGDILLTGLTGLWNYTKLTCRGIKKVFLTKLSGKFNKFIFLSWLAIESGCVYNSLFNYHVKEWAIGFLTGAIVLPGLNLLRTRNDELKEANKALDKTFRLMGFKSDEMTGEQFPYLLDIREHEKEIVYLFKANNNKLNNFRNNADLLEEITNLELLEVRKNQNNRGLIEIVFNNPNYDVEDERINIDDRNNEDEDCIRINQYITWNFRKDPHMFINGGTGGGKTFFIFYIIKSLMEKKTILKVIDPKMSALSRLKDIINPKDVACKKDDIIKLVNEYAEMMYKRSEELDTLRRQANDKTISNDYKDYNLKPCFLVFDELMAFMAMVDNKQGKEVMDKLTEIITMGRELGVFVLIALQRGDTTSFKGALRDQMHARFVLGRVGDDGVKMAFGKNYKLNYSTKEKGTGFIQIHTVEGLEEPREFQSPYIDKKYEILEEIEKIYQVNYKNNQADLAKNEKIIEGNFKPKKKTLKDLQVEKKLNLEKTAYNSKN